MQTEAETLGSRVALKEAWTTGEVTRTIVLPTYGSKVKIQGAPTPGGPTNPLIFIPSSTALHLSRSVCAAGKAELRAGTVLMVFY